VAGPARRPLAAQHRVICGRPGRGFARVSAGFGFDRFLGRGVGRGQRRRWLGLQRLEEPQRAPQLGERRAAVAQQRVEGARAVAVADQGQAEVAVTIGMALEQLGLDALGALEPPGGARDAAGKQALQRALGREFVHERRLEGGELGRLLVADDDEFLRAQPVLEGVLGGARLALGGFRAARPRAVAAAGLGAGARKTDAMAKDPRNAGKSQATAGESSVPGYRNICREARRALHYAGVCSLSG
jgi:hypothetical protein